MPGCRSAPFLGGCFGGHALSLGRDCVYVNPGIIDFIVILWIDSIYQPIIIRADAGHFWELNMDAKKTDDTIVFADCGEDIICDLPPDTPEFTVRAIWGINPAGEVVGQWLDPPDSKPVTKPAQ